MVSSSSLILRSTNSRTRSVILEGLPDPSLRAIVPVFWNRAMNRAMVYLVVNTFSTFNADKICDGVSPSRW